ncbi:MAG TPA: response regulator [Polyangiaceae bacterium]|nr:response regulator [Polyangiaceae bacterium]
MTRVLFVDDETRVLEGLRLGLRGKRKVWDMVFHESARAALADVERNAVDVVVSDMRMPGMDGAELLSRVAAKRPEAARIILSGQMDENAAVRAASVAHRFLSKPCEAKVVESVITQALELHGWLRSDKLRSLIGGVESLPSLPRAYVELNEALANSAVSMTAIARIIESDPGMAAKVLQLVNSSFFGLPRKMASVGQAASYLGISTIKNLTLANSLFRELGASDAQAAERECERSLLRARIARRLFRDAAKGESAATAALLLHVGVLALQSKLPAECAENRAEAETRELGLHEIEIERLGVSHAEVGAYLLGLWGLPHEIVEAVSRHHAPVAELTELDLQAGVRIADALAERSLPAAGDGPCAELPAAVLAALGVAETVSQVEAEILRGLGGAR